MQDASESFQEVERRDSLWNECDRAGLEHRFLENWVHTGYHDHGCIRRGNPDSAQRARSVHLGHCEIKQYEVRLELVSPS